MAGRALCFFPHHPLRETPAGEAPGSGVLDVRRRHLGERPGGERESDATPENGERTFCHRVYGGALL